MPGSELKAGARRQMMKNAPKLFFVSILFSAIVSAATELSFRLPGTKNAYLQYMENISGGAPHSVDMFLSYFAPIGAAFAVMLSILGIILQVGFMSYCLKTVRGHKGGYRDIFEGFAIFWKTLSLLAVCAVLIALWTLLLIVPGAVAFYRYRQAYYILLDDPAKSAFRCIRESKRLMRGHKADLFVLDISFIGWYALSVLVTILLLLSLPFPIPFVMFWLSPYAGLSRAGFYDQLLEYVTV